MTALLELEAVEAGYGGIQVLHGIDLTVEQGTLSVMLGSNGAGKSTTMSVITGLLPKRGGTITFDGAEISRFSARDSVHRGIALVPEGRRVFPDLTVDLNLRVAEWAAGRRDGVNAIDRVYALFPRLDDRRRQLAGTLSGGEQQMLAIGRALVARPRLLLVDECSMGLAPVISQEVFRLLRQLADEGITVLVVEQNARILEFADAAFVLEQGKIVHSATGDAVSAVEERAAEAYLGRGR